MSVTITIPALSVDEVQEGNVQSALNSLRAAVTALQNTSPPVDPPPPATGSGISKFSQELSPVAVYNFNDNLEEESGNPDLTLVRHNGSTLEQYHELCPGVRGLKILNNQAYGLSVANSVPLKLQGDMSAQVMVRFDSTPTGNQFILAFGETSEAETENVHYEMIFKSPYNGLMSYFHEHASGVNDEAPSTDSVPAIGTTFLVGFTRIGNTVQTYLNGVPAGPPTTNMTPLSGGSDGRFLLSGIGGTFASKCDWVCGGLKLNDYGLTAAEMLAEYNRTLGSV